jgi:hypothetical protein
MESKNSRIDLETHFEVSLPSVCFWHLTPRGLLDELPNQLGAISLLSSSFKSTCETAKLKVTQIQSDCTPA